MPTIEFTCTHRVGSSESAARYTAFHKISARSLRGEGDVYGVAFQRECTMSIGTATLPRIWIGLVAGACLLTVGMTGNGVESQRGAVELSPSQGR